MRSYSIYKHDTTLKIAFGANFISPILIPDPLEQWGHLHSKKVVGFESCAVLPVVEALLFAPIVNVCLED